ncbi:putative F-box protein At1g47390 [Brassica rapa]|nr:putative F-box protein At1g47390 [Brassica rapa]XP_048635719.1 putative F-box protein At1g47390 [Brassica napus]
MMDSTKTKKAIAAHDQEELPWEMIEEILSHVPPISLVRFRTVCKRWNALLNDKTFLNNHKFTFRFILTTKSKIYSVSIDPKILVRELTLEVPGTESHIKHLVDCNEFLLCGMDKVAAVWNPWFKQSRWIKVNASQPSSQVVGIGYVNNNMRADEKRYKTIGSYWTDHSEWETQDFSSEVWKDPKLTPIQGDKSLKDKAAIFFTKCGVSLHGNVYWIAFYDKTDTLYHLLNFDFSSERFYAYFCDLPCGMNHPRNALVLRVFRGDRFSLLKQCYKTKKIEIWVTKNKINVEDGNDVVWMNFRTLSIPNFPGLVSNEYSSSQPSYFIDDKRLVLCSCDETGHPWIYVVEENKLISKVQLNDVFDPWPLHCTYFPSLVPVPRGPREEALLQD